MAECGTREDREVEWGAHGARAQGSGLDERYEHLTHYACMSHGPEPVGRRKMEAEAGVSPSEASESEFQFSYRPPPSGRGHTIQDTPKKATAGGWNISHRGEESAAKAGAMSV